MADNTCVKCGEGFVRTGNYQKYCDDCRWEVRRVKLAQYKKDYEARYPERRIQQQKNYRDKMKAS